MRILHLVHQYLPEKIGGTELYTRTLARHQIQNGASAAIFTPATAVAGDQPQVEDGIRVYRVSVGARSATTVFLSTFRQPALGHALARVLEREQPDLVHIQHLMGLPVNLVQQIRHLKRPFVITLHDYWHLCANAQLITNYDQTVCAGPRGWLNCAQCALARAGYHRATVAAPALVPLFAMRHQQLKRVLQQASRLIAPTHFTATIHQKMGIDAAKIAVIPHGIQLPAAPPVAKPPGQGPLHIAYIGGLSWQKGVHVLIDAVNQLGDTAIQLSIIGDTAAFPDYVAQLRAQAQHPGIRFVGRLPHAQLWSVLAGIDLVVVPSLWYETASLIVQEAFAAQTPVVASRLGALQERLVHDTDGWHFPPGDSQALADLLRRLQQNPAQLARLQAGIKPVQTIAAHVAQIEAVYQESLKI